MLDKMPDVPRPLTILGFSVLTGVASGCGEDGSAHAPLVPAACLQTWQDAEYPETETMNLTAAAPDLLPPELIGAQNDARRLIGFSASFLASTEERAVPADEVNGQVASGDLVMLGFEGTSARYADYDRVWQGAIVAPSEEEAFLPGQVDGALDLSAGHAEDPNSGWTWEGSFGTDPVTVSLVFLTDDCRTAVPSLEGDAFSTYTASPEGVKEVQ